VHDFATGTDLVLTHSENPFDHPTRTKRAFSPDSKQIAYIWVTSRNGEERSEVRISGLKTDASAKARGLFTTEDRLEADDWSPNGKWIALQIMRKDRTRQIGLVSTADGSLRVLKTIDWSGSSRVSFSPDSQYLAFDLPSGDGSEKRDVFVLAVDGRREISAVIHPADDSLAGWTPDGKHLLFVSDRNGLPSLWWLRFEGGNPRGNPEMLRPNFGTNVMRPTRSGDLYYIVLGGGVKISVASVDSASGKMTTGSLQQFTGDIYPAWSPDGKYLAYSAYQLPSGSDIFLAIRSLETGQSRELRPKVKYPKWPTWSPDSRSLLVEAADLKGRQGIFKVDAQTAEAEPIVTAARTNEAMLTPQWLPDGKRILYEHAIENGDSAIVERELASGKESEVVRIKVLRDQSSATRSFALSPDGRSLAYLTSNGTTAHTAIMLMPLSGGEPRELLEVNEFTFLGGWTPDGQALLYSRSDGVPPPGWGLSRDFVGWILPVHGGEPRKLELGENFVSQIQMHPDGKRVVFWSNNQTAEQVWVLENYLPTLPSKN
jgi:Tol biopolymer transport system component